MTIMSAKCPDCGDQLNMLPKPTKWWCPKCEKVLDISEINWLPIEEAKE